MAVKKANSEDQQVYLHYGIDIKKRRLFLDDEIESFSVGLVFRAIDLMLDINKTDPITMVINSFGGSVYDGFLLYDALEELECELITHARGSVMSMALILFLIGDTRRMSKRSTAMAHSLSSGSSGTVNEQEVDLKESKRLNNLLLDILADKTQKTRKWWADKIKHEDFYIDNNKAKKLGITND